MLKKHVVIVCYVRCIVWWIEGKVWRLIRCLKMIYCDYLGSFSLSLNPLMGSAACALRQVLL
jgi:hypothetical protein